MLVQARILKGQTLRKTGYDAQNTFLLENEVNNQYQCQNSKYATGKGQTKGRTIPLGKEEIQNAIAQHSPSVDTSITTMMSDIGAALDFEDIKEEDINETRLGSRLDELGKVTIKKKHLNTLSSLNAFIGFTKEYEKDHEKTLQAASSMVKSAKLKKKYTPCPPMEEVNEKLARFIAFAKRMKEKGSYIRRLFNVSSSCNFPFF